MGCFHGIRSNDDVELWCEMIRYGVTGGIFMLLLDTKLKVKGWVRWDVGKFMLELSTSIYECEGKNS